MNAGDSVCCWVCQCTTYLVPGGRRARLVRHEDEWINCNDIHTFKARGKNLRRAKSCKANIRPFAKLLKRVEQSMLRQSHTFPSLVIRLFSSCYHYHYSDPSPQIPQTPPRCNFSSFLFSREACRSFCV